MLTFAALAFVISCNTTHASISDPVLPDPLELEDGEGDPIVERIIGPIPEQILSEPEISAMSTATDGDIIVRRFDGQLDGSIAASVKRLTGSDLLSYTFLNAFLLEPDLQERIQPGARFYVELEGVEKNGVFQPNGKLLSAGLEISGMLVERFRVPMGDHTFYVPLRADEDRQLFAPLEHLNVSSLFSPRRLHPIKRKWRAHKGVDFREKKGAPVFAAADGQIVSLGRGLGTGRYVAIWHDNGLETQYQHLSQFQKGLRIGDRVRAGDPIGKVGCTGWCRGSHLHFALKLWGEWENPLYFMRTYPVAAQDRVASLRLSPDQSRAWLVRRPSAIDVGLVRPPKVSIAKPTPATFQATLRPFN